MNESPATTPGAPDIDTGIEFVYDETQELDPPHDVFVHNDDVTPFEFVVAVLQAIFELPAPEAYRVTLTAHEHGRAYVATLPVEDAKYRVYRAHRAARARNYPLTFSIQPVR
ncbi:MAG TPA: ATP-dependent Clp protease adaptor ClpS [Anaerolineae bacterium]|nr:ATP-dependent Clp protease adaptor ClpS [Anaerolineae bacterium]